MEIVYQPEPKKDGRVYIKSYEVDESGFKSKIHRKMLQPNSDVSNYPQDIQDVCNAWWQHNSGEPLSEEEQLQKERQQMSLEAGDFKVGIALLSYENGAIEPVYDENGDNTGLEPLEITIQNAISGLSGKDKVKFQKLLENRTQFRRTNEDVQTIANLLGMSEADIDEFFNQAKQL